MACLCATVLGFLFGTAPIAKHDPSGWGLESLGGFSLRWLVPGMGCFIDRAEPGHAQSRASVFLELPQHDGRAPTGDNDPLGVISPVY